MNVTKENKRAMLVAAMLMSLNHECDNCGGVEERVFEDTYTGKALCIECLIRLAPYITMSPSEEGDNLESLMAKDQDDEEDEEDE